jgi:hypothetical protein
LGYFIDGSLKTLGFRRLNLQALAPDAKGGALGEGSGLEGVSIGEAR